MTNIKLKKSEKIIRSITLDIEIIKIALLFLKNPVITHKIAIISKIDKIINKTIFTTNL